MVALAPKDHKAFDRCAIEASDVGHQVNHVTVHMTGFHRMMMD